MILPTSGQLCDILDEFSGTLHFLTHPPSYKNNMVFFWASANTPARSRALAHRRTAASGFHYQALFLQLHPGNSFHVQNKNLGSSEITWTCASGHRARIFPSSQDALSQVTISFSCHDSHWEPPASPELFQAWKSCCCTEFFAPFSWRSALCTLQRWCRGLSHSFLLCNMQFSVIFYLSS